MPGYNSRSRRRNNTARTLTAIGTGLSALSNSMAASQASRTAPPPSYTPPPYTPPPSNGYGGITTNQSRQQMSASTNVSASVVNGGSGYCGVGYTGPQQFNIPGITTMNKNLPGGYRMVFEGASSAQVRGIKVSGGEVWKGSQKYLNFTFFWLDSAAGSGVSSFNSGLSKLRGDEAKNSQIHGSLKNYVIESPTRYMFLKTFQASDHYGAPVLTKQQVAGVLCGLFSKLEPRAAAKNGSSSTTPTPSRSGYGGYVNPNVNVPYHGNDSVFGL